jgi:hypothetical protein
MTKTNKGILLAGAAAALFLAGAVNARAEDKAGGDQVNCSGINSCKGKGNIKTSAAECKAKGGKVVESK